jgi:inositol transport system substrate-binding protein
MGGIANHNLLRKVSICGTRVDSVGFLLYFYSQLNKQLSKSLGTNHHDALGPFEFDINYTPRTIGKRSLSIQTTQNTKQYSSDCPSINPSRNEMKPIIITLAASVTNFDFRCGLGSNMKKLCFSFSLVALFVIASVTAHAETKIGVAVSLFDDMWLTTLRHGMQSYAEKLGDVKLNFEDARGDVTNQQNQVQNFIASKVDGILVAPLVDPSAGPVISKAAHEAGIPLVFVNNAPVNVDSLPEDQAFVGSDDLEAGTLQTEAVCKLLGGKGKVLVMLGQLGTTGQRFRTQGVHDVIKRDKCNGMEILEEQTANYMRVPAIDLMSNWLTAGFKFDAVIANNDEMALGAIESLKANRVPMDKVVVAGVDATPDALAAVKAGDLDVTVFQNAPGQGRLAIDVLLKLIKREKVDKKNLVPFELVTKENLDKYLGAK